MLTIAKAQTGKATQRHYQKNYQNDCTGCLLLKQNYQLKNEAGYWKNLHQRATERVEKLEEEQKESNARIRYLSQQLYGRKTEKNKSSEQVKKVNTNKKNRGQQPGSPQHPKRRYNHLPTIPEIHDLEEKQKICPCCGLPYKELPQTEDSTIIEIEVKAHTRKISKKKYTRTCNCETSPGITHRCRSGKIIAKNQNRHFNLGLDPSGKIPFWNSCLSYFKTIKYV